MMQKLAHHSTTVPAFTEDRFVITSAVNNTAVHEGFWDTLVNFCTVNKARLVVIPLQYKNPTSQSEESNADIWYDLRVMPYLYRGRAELCENLTLCADVLTQPTAVKPLSGLTTFGGRSSRDSVIFAHPKIAMESVATQAGKMAKWAVTTGACTESVYSDTKTGKKGEFHHIFAALVVERDSDRFHIRHVVGSGRDGHFFDLDKRYSGTEVTSSTAKVLTVGDLHAVRADPTVLDATFFSADSMVATLQPAHIVLHDVLDFQCASHHNDFMTKFKLFHQGKSSVTQEIVQTCNLLDSLADAAPTAHFYIVDSNHDRHFERWLNGNEGAADKQNTLMFHETRVAWMKAALLDKPFAPLEHWATLLMKHRKRFTFLTSNDSLVFDGVEYAAHGDRAPNGARGSREAFVKVGTKMVIGHSHSPGATDGVYQVGTSSVMDMGYNAGFSSWLQTHCVSYPTGKRTLVTCVNGFWRLK